MPKLSKSDRSARVSQSEADRRRSLALAELRELEVQQKRGELVAVAEVTAAWAGMISAARAQLLTIGGDVCDQCREIVDARTRIALNELAKGVRQCQS